MGGLGWVWAISTLLNRLLGFKGPTHLILTQTHPFDNPRPGPFFFICEQFEH